MIDGAIYMRARTIDIVLLQPNRIGLNCVCDINSEFA